MTRIRIADLLREGRENAITREELQMLTGLSDRKVRECINAERLSGEVILSESNGVSGYWLPSRGTDARAELKRFVLEQKSRSRETAKIAEPAERMLMEVWGDVV